MTADLLLVNGLENAAVLSHGWNNLSLFDLLPEDKFQKEAYTPQLPKSLPIPESNGGQDDRVNLFIFRQSRVTFQSHWLDDRTIHH